MEVLLVMLLLGGGCSLRRHRLAAGPALPRPDTGPCASDARTACLLPTGAAE